MSKTLRYKPKFDPLKDLLLDMAKERSCESVLSLIVNRLTRSSQVALCRIWLTRPVCEVCAEEDETQTECLHLVASAGKSKDGTLWDGKSDSDFHRFSMGARKVGQIASTGKPLEVGDVGQDSSWMARPEWAEAEGIRGFGGQPLVFKDRVLGVLAVFTRMPLEEEWLTWLRMIADHAAAAIANSRSFEEIESLKEQLELENTFLRQEISESLDFGSIIGQSPVMHHTIQQIELAAPTEASVLILGESGTGKELIAREIHQRSARSGKPLIKVNCAYIPRERFESECFGHTRGAFTGAFRDRAGRFDAANHGTLFLDEVGEIPLELQGKLLRVLQEGEFERVGEEKTRSTDVRVVAATNRDLRKEVEAGRFREDLYFRLNVFPIEAAPLRSRKGDIPLLAAHFIESSALKLGRPAPRLSEAALGRLESYSWPGNVRELQNVIERGVITSTGETLRIDMISLTSPAADLIAGADPVATDGIMTEDELVEFQKKNLTSALNRTGWKIYGPGGTAELLGLRPTTLASRIKKWDLKRSR